jgi:hypothetical protein
MTGLNLIPLNFSLEVDLWGQINDVLLYKRICRLNFIVLDGKLAARHQKKDMNPHCICLIMNVPKHYPSQKHSRGRKIWVPIGFIQTRKLLQAFRYQLKRLKPTLSKGLAFAKKIPALVNLWAINMNGKTY